jgi:isoquinoline 1-oxidoreductase alpha subunit
LVAFKINGEAHSLNVDPQMPLLWLLRDRFNLTATKYGCGRGVCGACTVHVDGQPAFSCSIMVGDLDGKSITTLEGLSGVVAMAVQASWRTLDVVQCGYCQPGQIMTAVALLSQNRTPRDEDIAQAMDGNLCRCGTYQRIKAAIHAAAKLLEYK